MARRLTPASRAMSAGVLALAALAASAGCSDHPPTAPGSQSSTRPVVSDPVAATVRASAAPARAAAASVAAASASISYVSLPAGSYPTGTMAIVRNLVTGASLTVPMARGGFDPVAIVASVGDELAIDVRGPGGTLASLTEKVPSRRPPTVVRTSPPKGKTDVPLNSRIYVVFSEPLDVTTVTTAVRLSTNGRLVAGTVQPDESGLRAWFVPQVQLASSTEYELVVTTAVRDLSGDALEAAASIPFTTGTQATPVTRLAIVRGDDQIWLLNSDGTSLVRLTSGGRNADPSWSPDGRRIAFASDRGGAGWDIYVMDADGSNVVRRTSAGNAWQPAWSPDGRRLVFTSWRDGYDMEIYTTSAADGTSPIRLTSHPGDDVEPAWSPDGSTIAFTSHRDGIYDVYAMRPDGSGLTRLTSGVADDLSYFSPHWSRDGSKISFISQRCRGDITPCPESFRGMNSPEVRLLVANADGSGATPVLSTGASISSPAWSPDGRTIAYTSWGSPDGTWRRSVWYVRADGSDEDVIALDGYSPSWRW